MTPSPAPWSVVVGATGAIGSVVTARLLAEDHRVIAVSRSAEDLRGLAEQHPGLETLPADVTDPRCGDAVAAVVGEDGVRLVAHLASAPLGGDILATDDDVIARAFDVKVVGLLRLVRALRDELRRDAAAGGAPRVVAVGGNLGFDPVPGASTAGLANAAQANLVRQLARALGPDGVTCHTVAPGPVETPRWRTLAAAEAERRGVALDDVRAEAVAGAPTGALTTPEQVAWAVARLCDTEATALSGGTLILDGGRRTAIP